MCGDVATYTFKNSAGRTRLVRVHWRGGLTWKKTPHDSDSNSVARRPHVFSTAPEPLCREAAESVVGILASSVIRVIPQSRDSFLAGLQLYRARPDKGYSLVDCISMQAMRKEGLTEVLTNDRHFEQEGFRALFRDS